MIGWLWFGAMAAPVMVFNWLSYSYQKRADQHRRPEFPKNDLVWHPWDLFRPHLYTVEGNRLRTRAAWLYMPIPLLWIAGVFTVQYIVMQW